MQRWGPWTAAMLHKLRYDVRGYFRAYYAELRKLVAENEDAHLPPWFRGGRRIVTHSCTDGALVVHSPLDPEAVEPPEGEDAYSFHFAVEPGDNRMWPVGPFAHKHYGPKFPDGSKLEAMPSYTLGEDFGTYVRLWPAYMISHPLPDGRGVAVRSEWTRLVFMASGWHGKGHGTLG